jgi:hypothetical protein
MRDAALGPSAADRVPDVRVAESFTKLRDRTADVGAIAQQMEFIWNLYEQKDQPAAVENRVPLYAGRHLDRWY